METVEYRGKKYELVDVGAFVCIGCAVQDICSQPWPCSANKQLREIKPKTVTIDGVKYEFVEGDGCEGCDRLNHSDGCNIVVSNFSPICHSNNNNGKSMILKRVKPAENELTGKQHGDINDAINYTLRSVLNIIELKKLAKNKENKAIKADLDRLTKENEALKAENDELKQHIRKIDADTRGLRKRINF